MKLLLDENLSRRLVSHLQSAFPGTSQVVEVGLAAADDLAVWRYAREHGFALVTKDDDFRSLAALHGPPPVVVRLALGNAGNARVLATLLRSQAAIEAAASQPGVRVIELT